MSAQLCSCLRLLSPSSSPPSHLFTPLTPLSSAASVTRFTQTLLYCCLTEFDTETETGGKTQWAADKPPSVEALLWRPSPEHAGRAVRPRSKRWDHSFYRFEWWNDISNEGDIHVNKRFHGSGKTYLWFGWFLLGFIKVYILYFGTRTKELRHTRQKKATLIFLKMWELYEVSVCKCTCIKVYCTIWSTGISVQWLDFQWFQIQEPFLTLKASYELFQPLNKLWHTGWFVFFLKAGCFVCFFLSFISLYSVVSTVCILFVCAESTANAKCFECLFLFHDHISGLDSEICCCDAYEDNSFQSSHIHFKWLI